MDETQATARLSDLVAAGTFPTLSPEQLTRLIRDYRREDAYGYLASSDVEWTAATAYDIDDTTVPTVRNGHVYRVTTAGTSGAAEPVWPVTDGGTVVDGTVTWTEVTATVSVWEGTWDFNRAAAEGWRIKAGLVTNRHSFGSNAGNYNPEQVFDHCMKMAEHYASRGMAMVRLSSGRWSGEGGLPAAHYEDAV